MTRQASIVWLTGLCRVGSACSDYGVPYATALTLQWVDEGTYELQGVDKPLSHADRRAVMIACREEGITRVQVRRIDQSGRTRLRRHNTGIPENTTLLRSSMDNGTHHAGHLP